MGEVALARGMSDVALEQYLEASRRMADAGIARRATLIAVQSGNTDVAQAAADRWEALAPADDEVAQYQAVLHARADDTAEALRYLLRLADDLGADAPGADNPAANDHGSDGGPGPGTGANLQMITGLLAGESNRWRAADLMADVAAARPQHAEGWYGAALLALEADRPAQAATFAARAVEQAPNLLDAVFLRARSQLVLRAGAANSEQILEPLAGFRHAADPGLRYRYAGLLVLAGRAGEADALYEDILVNDPDQHDARVARALLALEDGRLDVADAELHTLLERHGRVQDALYYLGAVAERRGAPDEAVDWYARVSPDVPLWLEAQAAIGRVLLEIDGPEAARQFFSELRGFWPEYALPLSLHEAGVLTFAGYPERALPLLQDVIARADGEYPELSWQVALAAAEAGESALADSVLRELLAADPRNPSLQNALGYLLLEQDGSLEEAEKLLESAHAGAPANPVVLDSLGWLRLRQERYPEARRLLEESWRREPSPVTGIHLLTTLLAVDSVAAADFRMELRERFPLLTDIEGG